MSPEPCLVEEDGADRADHVDRADAKAPFVVIEIVDLLAWIEDEGTSTVVTLLIQDDGGVEVFIAVLSAPLQFEAEIFDEAAGSRGAVAEKGDHPDLKGAG